MSSEAKTLSIQHLDLVARATSDANRATLTVLAGLTIQTGSIFYLTFYTRYVISPFSHLSRDVGT